MLMSKKMAQGILDRAAERESGGIDVAAAKRLAAEFEVKAAKRRKYPDPFMEGIAIACADLVRLFDQPGMAVGIIAGHGFTLADFKGCESYDLDIIHKLFRTEAALNP